MIILKRKNLNQDTQWRYADKMTYCFTVNNLEEETQMNDFLGIFPEGPEIDLYLSELNQEQLLEWKNYWIDMWNSLGRTDMIPFVNEMYDKYFIPEYPKRICR